MRELTKGKMILSFPKAIEWRIPLRRVRFWMKGTPLFLYKEKQLKKILADDKEIRDITEPWMAQLSDLMKNSSTNRKLSNTYGAGNTA